MEVKRGRRKLPDTGRVVVMRTMYMCLDSRELIVACRGKRKEKL